MTADGCGFTEDWIICFDGNNGELAADAVFCRRTGKAVFSAMKQGEDKAYDAQSGSLIIQRGNHFKVLRLNAEDSFEKAYELVTQDITARMSFGCDISDGEYLVLNGDILTDIFLIADGTLHCRIVHTEGNAPFLAINDGVLFDMRGGQTGGMGKYTLEDTARLRRLGKAYLEERGGMRQLSLEERALYYIPEEWG